MEPSWIILTFMSIVILIVMIYFFRQNNKDRKQYEKDLAEKIVWKTPGIWSVDNQLVVEHKYAISE